MKKPPKLTHKVVAPVEFDADDLNGDKEAGDNFDNFGVREGEWEPVPVKDVPKGSKILTSTWAMKKKVNETYRARMNACGYEQVDRVHYNQDAKAAPVANEIVIRMVLVSIIMSSWWAELLDVQGAFLTGEVDLKNCYLQVPERFSKFYLGNTVLKLLKTLYSLKQSVFVFWKSLIKTF